MNNITPSFSFLETSRMNRIATLKAATIELRQERAATHQDQCARISDIDLELWYIRRELKELTS